MERCELSTKEITRYSIIENVEKGSYDKRKRQPKHRSWREPMPKEGMMLQFDTSDHDWLEGRGPKIKLIGGIDDATKNVPSSIPLCR